MYFNGGFYCKFTTFIQDNILTCISKLFKDYSEIAVFTKKNKTYNIQIMIVRGELIS